MPAHPVQPPARGAAPTRSALCPPPPTPRAAATLVDVVGSAALLTLSPKGGVSLNINVNYLRKAAAGREVVIEARVSCIPAPPAFFDGWC